MNLNLFFEVLIGRFVIMIIGLLISFKSNADETPVFYIYNINDNYIQTAIDSESYKYAKDYEQFLKFLNDKRSLNEFDYDLQPANLIIDDIKEYKFEAINVNSKSSGAPTCIC